VSQDDRTPDSPAPSCSAAAGGGPLLEDHNVLNRKRGKVQKKDSDSGSDFSPPKRKIVVLSESEESDDSSRTPDLCEIYSTLPSDSSRKRAAGLHSNNEPLESREPEERGNAASLRTPTLFERTVVCVQLSPSIDGK